MKKYNLAIIMCLIPLMMGCVSDKYSIEEIREYANTNQNILFYAADMASYVLRDDYYSMSASENGRIYIYDTREREYTDLDDVYETSEEDRRVLNIIFNQGYVNYIYINRYDNSDDKSQEQSDYREKDNKTCICMNIPGGRDFGYSEIRYILFFSDIQDVTDFTNPMEDYNKGGFKKKIDVADDSVKWTSDNRYRFWSDLPVKFEAFIIKATDGIWICRWEIDVPLIEVLFHA